MRIERDFLGEREIDDSCYYGIHTKRAIENFPILHRPMHQELILALTQVKKAAAIANHEAMTLETHKKNAIVSACDEILLGRFHDQVVVDALQGGAGTSANMNLNELIANRAIELLGGAKGEYHRVHPNDDVNQSQSTNDVFPTALRIAGIKLLDRVSLKFSKLQVALQEKEEAFHNILKIGRTQLQDAVPVLLGQEFGAYAQAIARDRWRLYKACERLRQVNIGGTAVGTGILASKKYIFRVIEVLRDLTGQGLSRAESTMDTTQNADVFVEVSGLLKTAAVNLIKISNDLRLLSSGPFGGIGEIKIPAVQGGSSIMPGKVNPVILEAINQIGFQIIGNDSTITMAASAGQLELNPFLPVIGHNLLEAMDLLDRGIDILVEKCIKGILVDEERCSSLVENSLVLVSAISPQIGYDKACELANHCLKENKTPREVLLEEGIFSSKELDEIFNPYALTKPMKF